MRPYEGKRAVITGGTHGMGMAVAKSLLAGGAEVILTGSNPKNVEKARKRGHSLRFSGWVHSFEMADRLYLHHPWQMKAGLRE